MKKNYLSCIGKRFYTLVLLMMLFLNAQLLQASILEVLQQNVITGTVLDESSLPIIGVTISVKGSNVATITNIDGHYSIAVPSSKSVLSFSFIGYLTKEITVGDKKVIHETLKEEVHNLDEVVVVGYGVQKKSHLTGSISKVKTDGLEDIPVSRVDQALQGRIAGVQIQNTTSEVGEAPTIRVRGMGSISAGDEPLIIIDGFPIAGGLGVIDVNDIASMEVLKDAASAAIYGSRAANGVILITTKSGDSKKPKYTIKTSFGIKEAYELHPILTTKEYVAMRTRESLLLGATQLPDQEFAFFVLDDSETDWQKEALRTAYIHNTQFAVSGGSKDVMYYISGSYANDQGIMLNNEYQKANIRAKIDANLSKKIKVGVNLNPSYSQQEKPSTQFTDFYRTPSWMPVRHTAQTAAITGFQEGSYAYGNQFNAKTYVGIDPISGLERTVVVSPFSSSNHNPKMVLDTDKRFSNDYRMQTSGYLTIELAKDMEFKTSNGFNIRYNEQEEYRDKDSKTDGTINRALYKNSLFVDLLSENTLSYLKKVGKHDFNTLLGFSAQKTTTKIAGLVGQNFPTDFIHTLNAANEIALYENGTRVSGTWKEEEALISFYGRLIYNYNDRYLLSGSLRTDGSSKFGDDNRWALFPSISFGWRADQEKFLKEVDWLSQLKLRTSYGVTGNDKIVNYAKMNMLNSANYPLGASNGDVTGGLANNSSTLGNPALKWEQTNEYNLGVDIGLLDSRINLTAEYYYSVTKQLLYQRSLSSITGYDNQWSNLGKVRNSGFEFELTTYNIKNKKFEWTTSFNLATNQNKLLDIGGPQSLISVGTEANESYIAQVGAPAIQFYGFKAIGVWKDQAEIDANPHHSSDKPGGLRIYDRDQNGKIDDGDRMVIGNPFPDFTWGISNTLKYKEFDLTFLFQGVQGGDVYNGDARYNEARKWNENYITNRWISPEHPGDGKTPYFNYGYNWMLTDYVIEDGSYIALRDLTLGYTLPKKVCEKFGVSKLRAYASSQNVAFWWADGYRGVNPESRYNSGVYGDNPLISGYQRGGFPIQRTFSVGIDLTF